MIYCSPGFNDNSDTQIQATWPAPNGVSEYMATSTCRSIIVNKAVIGKSCFDSIGHASSSDDIVQACVKDVQVCYSVANIRQVTVRRLILRFVHHSTVVAYFVAKRRLFPIRFLSQLRGSKRSVIDNSRFLPEFDHFPTQRQTHPIVQMI